MESDHITHLEKVQMMIPDHKNQLPMFTTQVGHYLIVVGTPLLRLHDVTVWFSLKPLGLDHSTARHTQ